MIVDSIPHVTLSSDLLSSGITTSGLLPLLTQDSVGQDEISQLNLFSEQQLQKDLDFLLEDSEQDIISSNDYQSEVFDDEINLELDLDVEKESSVLSVIKQQSKNVFDDNLFQILINGNSSFESSNIKKKSTKSKTKSKRKRIRVFPRKGTDEYKKFREQNTKSSRESKKKARNAVLQKQEYLKQLKIKNALLKSTFKKLNAEKSKLLLSFSTDSVSCIV